MSNCTISMINNLCSRISFLTRKIENLEQQITIIRNDCCGPPLAEVLDSGNTTANANFISGNNIVMSTISPGIVNQLTGQDDIGGLLHIRGGNNITTEGGNVLIQGGDTSVTTGIQGGDVTISGGQNIPIANVNSGSIDIITNSVGFTADSGNIILNTGDGGSADLVSGGGTTGRIDLITGKGGDSSSSQIGTSGGTINIISGDGGDGDPVVSGQPGGTINITSGTGGINNGGGGGIGGAINITAGLSNNALLGSNVNIISGSVADSGEAGDIVLAGGIGGNSGKGGDIFLNAGVGGSSSGNGGTIILTTATGTNGNSGQIQLNSGNVSNGNIAGNIELNAGDSLDTLSTGGQVNLTTGDSGDGISGGSVNVGTGRGGDEDGTPATGTGGDVNYNLGEGGDSITIEGGRGGNFVINAGDGGNSVDFTGGRGGDIILEPGQYGESTNDDDGPPGKIQLASNIDLKPTVLYNYQKQLTPVCFRANDGSAVDELVINNLSGGDDSRVRVWGSNSTNHEAGFTTTDIAGRIGLVYNGFTGGDEYNIGSLIIYVIINDRNEREHSGANDYHWVATVSWDASYTYNGTRITDKIVTEGVLSVFTNAGSGIAIPTGISSLYPGSAGNLLYDEDNQVAIQIKVAAPSTLFANSGGSAEHLAINYHLFQVEGPK